MRRINDAAQITPRAFGRDWRLPITNRYGNGQATSVGKCAQRVVNKT